MLLYVYVILYLLKLNVFYRNPILYHYLFYFLLHKYFYQSKEHQIRFLYFVLIKNKLSIEEKIKYLEKHQSYTSVSEGVRNALEHADIIIYSAGTQHSSLYPTYLSSGLAETIADNKNASKIFITNIGADYETPSYKASDYLLGAFRYLNLSDKRDYSIPELFDAILVNQSNFKHDETYVEFDQSNYKNIDAKLILDSFESENSPGKHDGQKLTDEIFNLFQSDKYIKLK